MSPRRWAVLALVLVLTAAALVLGRGDDSGRRPADGLGALRDAAALQSCPGGLGPELGGAPLPCLGGGPAVSTRPPGTPLVVNLWATWCAPCVREIPVLAEFARRAGSRVGVVGLLHQDLPANALEFARQAGMRYPSVVDERGEVLRSFGSGPPITLLLDAAGRVQHVRRGEFTSVEELQTLVLARLGVRL